MSQMCYRLLTLLCLALWLCTSSHQPAHLLAQSGQVIIPIYQIQGKALISPYYKKWLDTYGLVTGVLRDGFYLQDPSGDKDTTTSDGIFVYTRSVPPVQVGQCIAVTRAYVDEFYEKTELSRFKALLPTNRCANTTVSPAAIPLARLGTAPTVLFEPYEGMLVTISHLAGIVQGATKHFANGEAELALIPSGLHHYLPDERVFQAETPAMNALMYLTNELGATLPEVAWGATVQIGAPAGDVLTTAILDYNFGKYQLHLLPGTPIASQPGDLMPEQGGAATPDDFTICTYNLLGLGRGSAQYPVDQNYAVQLAKRARTIAETLQGCTIIGLQETGTPADAENLADFLRTTYNLDYSATALAGPGTQSGEFPLTNSLLARRDRVAVLQAAIPQGCSHQSYDVPVVPGDCPTGQYALFDRPPLVVDLRVQGAWQQPLVLTVFVNHWKSKAGDETSNAVRRLAQARHVAALVQQKIEQEPNASVVVLGDLNDYYQSQPIETLKSAITPPLHHLYDYLPVLDRYSYIFNGGSQILDHILVTANLIPMVATVDLVHSNANYPSAEQNELHLLQRSSDHDPAQVRLRPNGATVLAGNLRYPHIHVQLRDANPQRVQPNATAGTIIGETITDDNGEFRFWNLLPGVYTLSFTPPAVITLDEKPILLDLPAGYHTIADIPATHRTVKFGMALARTAATLTATLAATGTHQ